MRGLFHGKSQSKMDDERGTLHFRTPPYHVISLYIWLCDCISPVHSKFIHVSLLIPLCSKPNAINRPMNQPWVGSCYIIPVIEVYPISSNFINLACVDSLSHGVCHIICSYMFIIFHHIILYHIISYHIIFAWWFGTFGLFFHSVGNFLIPTDEVIIFRGVGQPPTMISPRSPFRP